MINPLHTTPELFKALQAVVAERARQDAKWGEQNHDYPVWLAILQEELGEAAQEWLPMNFGDLTREQLLARKQAFRAELVQCAAVLLAMVECGDRNWWFE